jgi:tRNA A37 threonylcarbamoyladenosine modification protein TsaB
MRILTVENFLANCGFILQDDGNLVDKYRFPAGEHSSDKLVYCLEEFLNRNKLDYSAIDILSVAKGPGNFTTLKVLMTFAKGFRSCFPDKPIISNSLFEILTFGKEYDKALLDVGERVIYVFDKNTYRFVDRDNPKDALNSGDRVITNSHFLLDLLKNDCTISEKSLEEGTIVSINYKKAVSNDFDDSLEPLYIREPAINRR